MPKNNQVAVVGCANAGKSTLVNKLVQKNVSIVSPMAQTTRNAIPNLFSNLILWDTPGILKPKNKLDKFLIDEVNYSIKKSCIILFLIDSTKKINSQLEEICCYLNKFKEKKIILVYSKKDLIKDKNSFELLKKTITNFLPNIYKTFTFDLHNDNLYELIFEIQNLSNDLVSNEDDFSIDENWKDDLLIKDLVRQQIINHSFQEVPHSSSVIIEQKKYDEVKNIFHIYCVIIVEKESQKKIIIGKNGLKIKQIGIDARKAISEIYDCKINLKLFCKVKKDWRNDDYLLKSFGYKKWQK